jgi:hypothetical protein
VALVIDDVQWADRPSVEALSFAFRRLSVDAVAVILIVRGDRDQLDAPTRRMLLSVAQRRRIVLHGLTVSDVAPLAAALGAGPLGSDALRRLHDRTGGHTLYLRTVLSDREGLERLDLLQRAASLRRTLVRPMRLDYMEYQSSMASIARQSPLIPENWGKPGTK